MSSQKIHPQTSKIKHPKLYNSSPPSQKFTPFATFVLSPSILFFPVPQPLPFPAPSPLVLRPARLSPYLPHSPSPPILFFPVPSCSAASSPKPLFAPFDLSPHPVLPRPAAASPLCPVPPVLRRARRSPHSTYMPHSTYPPSLKTLLTIKTLPCPAASSPLCAHHFPLSFSHKNKKMTKLWDNSTKSTNFVATNPN